MPIVTRRPATSHQDQVRRQLDSQLDGRPGEARPGTGAGGADAASRIRSVLGDLADAFGGLAPSGLAPSGAPAPATTAAPGAPVGPETKLGTAGDREVFVSKSGQLVPAAGQDAPKNNLEQGELLFHAAQASERGENLFQNPAITLAQKEALLGQLKGAFLAADPKIALQSGFQTKDQALQTRASAAPLFLDLAKSLDPQKAAPAGEQEKALQQKVVGEYLKALETEPNGVARNFMIYDLHRAKKALPGVEGLREVSDQLMREVAPLTPPYEKWFEGGNEKLRVDYHVGAGFWEEEVGHYTGKGWDKKENDDGTVTLTKRYEVEKPGEDGGEPRKVMTEIEMTMHNGSSDLFKKMDDPNTHIVIYSGHADYGRHVPSQLARGDDQVGDKLFMGLQCGGKGTQNAIADKYPDLQQVQTKNSSYGYQDRRTVESVLEGISHRESWAHMSRTNQRQNADNYYFPSDTLINKRALDVDKDGKVDDFDRVVNYNAFRPEADIEKQLTATDPGKSASELHGGALHGAVLRFHRMAGYSRWAKHLEDQKVLNDGFYDGKATDPLVKLSEERGDGGLVYRVQVNKHYAHAGEDVLGAALHYELGMKFGKEGGLGDDDAKLAGVMMAAEAIKVDQSPYNDSQVFTQLKKYAGLPEGLTWYAAKDAIAQDETYSAGSHTTLRHLKKWMEENGVTLAP